MTFYTVIDYLTRLQLINITLSNVEKWYTLQFQVKKIENYIHTLP